MFSTSLCRHQGFGVLSVILANHAVTLLTSLFQDLQVEALHKVRDMHGRSAQQPRNRARGVSAGTEGPYTLGVIMATVAFAPGEAAWSRLITAFLAALLEP